jgi:hypothetical protein
LRFDSGTELRSVGWVRAMTAFLVTFLAAPGFVAGRLT